MNKEKALKNQGLEFREDITSEGGHSGKGCGIVKATVGYLP